MKGKNTYQFKKILFQSSRIDIAGGWHVGNKADNPACRYPKRGTDRDLIYNHSAITLENLMSGKLKAALLNIVRVFMSLQEKLTMIRKSRTFDEIMDSSATVENLLLMGPPGCGKTYGVAAMCAALGLPLGVHVCQSNMEESHVEGDAKIINGAIQTVPSKVGELYAIGGCIDLEEINLAEPGILQGVIGQALEYPYIFKYNGYYEMRRHPLTVFVGTMNPEAEGTRSLNEALASRFSHTVIVEPAPRAEMANILSSGGFKKRDCMKVIRIYEKILKYLEKYDPALTPRISMRACRECLVNLRCGFDWAQAVEQSFIGQIYAASPAVAGDIRTTLKPLLA